MAGSRTLKLSILADIDDLKKNLNNGSKEVEGFGDQLLSFGKKLAGAFALREVAQFGVEVAKAAAADEAAQLKLATSLKNVTGATQAQIKATEDYVLKTSLAYGVTDEKLRPSLDRLVRSTKDVAEAQKLQALALDISAGTGKDLESVSNALAKAHDGQFTALKKLGVSIDESIIKSKDFDAATAALASTFKDQATLQADTFDGKMRRLSVAFNEGKETIGGFIITAITPLVEKLVNNVIPAVADFGSNLQDKLKPIIKILQPVVEGLTQAFLSVRNSLVENSDKLQPLFDLMKKVGSFVANYLAPIVGEVLGGAFKILGGIVSGIVDTFSNLISIISGIYNRIKSLIDLIVSAKNAIGGIFGGGGSSASTPAPSVYGSGIGSSYDSRTGFYNPYGNTTINVSGAIDPESTARQINDILFNSQARGGGATNLLFA